MYSVLHVAQMYSYSETRAKLIETFSLHHFQMQLRDRSFNYLIVYGPTIRDAAFLHIQYYVVVFQKVVTHRYPCQCTRDVTDSLSYRYMTLRRGQKALAQSTTYMYNW